MPQEPLMEPAPEKMVRQLNLPDHSVGFYSELVSRESTRFQALSPIKRGTRYDTSAGADKRVIDLYPSGLFFLKEHTPLGGTEVRGMVQYKFVIWEWGTDQSADDTYNAEISYLAEAVNFPVYSRVSTVRREVYEANPTRDIRTPLDSVIAIQITAGGSGYTSATIVIDDPISGRTAKADAVIDANGSVSLGIITDEGSGYVAGIPPAPSTVPNVTINGDGTGATAIAIMQPGQAILTSQKKVELSQDDPYRNEYVSLVRVYETLPGPIIETDSIGHTNLIPLKYRKLVKTVETNQDVPADYTFPVGLTGDQAYVELAQQTIAKARLKIINEIITSGNALVGQETDEWGIDSIFESIVVDGTSADEGFFIKHSSVTPLGNGKSIKITVNYPADIGTQVRTSRLWDEEMRVEYNETRQLVAAGTTEDVIDAVVSEVKAQDKWHSVKINSAKIPAAVDEASAILSTSMRPFKFPGFVLPYLSPNGSPVYLHRRASAVLAKITRKTWWVTSPTRPVIAVDEIIADSVQLLDTPFIGSTFSVRVDDVLHNTIIRLDLGVVFPETTPSYATYFAGLTPISLTGTVSVSHGSTSVTGVGTIFLTEVTVGDLFFGIPVTVVTDDTHFTIATPWPYLSQTPFPAGGAYVQHVSGSPWVGTSRVIGAEVSPAKERNLWKVETENVIMR